MYCWDKFYMVADNKKQILTIQKHRWDYSIFLNKSSVDLFYKLLNIDYFCKFSSFKLWLLLNIQKIHNFLPKLIK